MRQDTEGYIQKARRGAGGGQEGDTLGVPLLPQKFDVTTQ